MTVLVIAPSEDAPKHQLPTRREALRRLKVLGWSKRKLAARARKHPTYVYRVFSGEYWPAPKVWPKLVAAIERGEREQREQRSA